MSEPRRCPQCDAEIPANSPAGLCPRCLLKASADSQSGAAPAEPGPTKLTPPASGFVPPTVEELAPLFPQLEILELLGKGGMGAVYKARQPGLDRLVAVKILPPEISRDPAFAERFQREARALARLSHPHIVAVYDFGQTMDVGWPPSAVPHDAANADGRGRPSYYIVMEFVDGANLRQTIKAGKLAPDEALAIVPQICEALQFAHDEGIVHRDIKPENILIDKRGRVKIADFGLAKLMANGGRESPGGSLTATHQVMGTLRYMAPEQMQGAREVDHRADIYSLGVVFYELLTGELPMGKFAPPSKKVQVDVRLDEIVLRALEHEPEQRYQHASEVKTDVETIARESQSPNHAAQKPAHRDGRAALTEPVSLPFEIAERVHWGLFGEVHGKLRLGNNALVVEFEVRSLFPAFRSGLKEVSIPFDDIESVNWDGWDLTLHTKTMKALAEIPNSSQGQVAFDLSMTDLDVPGGISEPVEHFLACLPSRLAGKSASVASPVSAKGATAEPRLVQAPADCLLLAAGIAFVTACGVAIWLGVMASRGHDLTTPLVRGNLTIASITLATYSLLIGVAGLLLRRLRARLFVLLSAVIAGLFLPAVVALNVVMEFPRMPEWPVAIPLWLGVPAALWVVVTLFRDDVRRAFDAANKQPAKNTEPGTASLPVDGVPLIGRQLKGPAITLMLYGLIVLFPAVLCFTNGFDIADGNDATPAAMGFAMIALSFLLLGLAGLLFRGSWHMLAMENYRAALLASFLGQPIGLWGLFVLSRPDVKTAFASASRMRAESLSRPKLVPVLATMNLVGAILLMLVCAMEQPPAFSPNVARVWQVWEKVDSVLGFTMAAGLFAASIGLFLWKPWARKLTLGVCIYGLASFVFDVPYLARFVLPDIYADIQQTIIDEGIEPEARDFVALFTVVVLFGGILIVGLTWLIGQLVYFTRPRVVAAFTSPNEKSGKFLDWLFTGAGAVVGVLSVFGPLALLLGLAALFNAGEGDKTVDPAAGRADSQTGEVWIGNKGAEIVMFLGPNSPTVSDRLARYLGLDPAQRAAMDQAFQKFFREFRALEEQNTRHETDEKGHQITTIAPLLQAIPPTEQRFWTDLESALDGRQLTLGRKTVGLQLGMFETGNYGYRIEIWRVGQIQPWYHWTESYPGRANVSQNVPQSAPELPEKLHRFWKEPETDDATNLQGTWVAVAGERNGGQPLTAGETGGVKVSFDHDHMRVTMQGRNDEGTLKLDVSQRPKRILVTRTEGPNRFGIMDGIYELDGDHLRLCMGEPEDRPTEFKTKAGSRLIALDLVRQTAVGPIAFEAVTGKLVQTGMLAIDRLGTFEVTFPRPFVGSPTFIFPREQFTGPGRFAVQQPTATGVTIEVSDAAFTREQPARLGWLATGDSATPSSKAE